MADNADTKIGWLCCPKCGGKTRTQIWPRTVLEEFPLFCPKCKYTCVIRFKDGKIEAKIAKADIHTTLIANGVITVK